MWLVQLYRANGDTTPSNVFIPDTCETEYIANYIDPDEYMHELSLCNSWEYNDKKKNLILKKGWGFTLSTLINERMIIHSSYIFGGIRYSNTNSFIIHEYLTESGFLMDFYIMANASYIIQVPEGTISSPSTIIADLLRYIRNKTLNIRVTGASDTKYSIRFDDDCKYYAFSSTIIIIKKPFLIALYYPYDSHQIRTRVYLFIHVVPKLIDEINDYSNPTSNYDPTTDKSISVDNIVAQYFNADTMSGLQYDNVGIDNYDEDINAFGYNLIRSLLAYFSSNLGSYYELDIDGSPLHLYEYSDNIGHSWRQTPLYTYFPLLRPRLDNQNSFHPYPQYNPSNENSGITSLEIQINLSSSRRSSRSFIDFFHIDATYFEGSSSNTCYISASGQLPSWDSDRCDLKVPFRFLGATNCSDPTTDNWSTRQAINNANYLFKIAKSEDSETYSIKGVGCNEITQTLSFNAYDELSCRISTRFLDSLQTVTLSGFGYVIESISAALLSLENSNETCFVLFSENLIEDENDFINIHTSIRNSLPNSIICYFGADSTVPRDLKNKVVHSNAIVTDLDTNEQMPLVIKYVNYAKRLHQLFN